MHDRLPAAVFARPDGGVERNELLLLPAGFIRTADAVGDDPCLSKTSRPKETRDHAPRPVRVHIRASPGKFQDCVRLHAPALVSPSAGVESESEAEVVFRGTMEWGPLSRHSAERIAAAGGRRQGWACYWRAPAFRWLAAPAALAR